MRSASKGDVGRIVGGSMVGGLILALVLSIIVFEGVQAIDVVDAVRSGGSL